VSRIVLLLLVTLAALAASGQAEACAVCFQAKSDAARIAFIASTAAMTFLPLAVVGGLTWWVRRQFVKADSAEPARESRP
jgi:hypothetical protein